MVGSGSYTTSTTNMYHNKHRFHHQHVPHQHVPQHRVHRTLACSVSSSRPSKTPRTTTSGTVPTANGWCDGIPVPPVTLPTLPPPAPSLPPPPAKWSKNTFCQSTHFAQTTHFGNHPCGQQRQQCPINTINVPPPRPPTTTPLRGTSGATRPIRPWCGVACLSFFEKMKNEKKEQKRCKVKMFQNKSLCRCSRATEFFNTYVSWRVAHWAGTGTFDAPTAAAPR